MGKRDPKAEDGHDAIVRRLLASQAKPVAAAPSDPIPSSKDLRAAGRRFCATALPGLRTFSGPSLDWRMDEVRSGAWKDVDDLTLASPLTLERVDGPALGALIACDAAFLTALMASLFGLVSERRSDPTASELSVFAQLVVTLRDAIDADLAHEPPGPPADCLHRFAPSDAAPLTVDLEIVFEDTTGRLRVMMTRCVAACFLPTENSRSANGMNRLPLAGTFALPGPHLTLSEISALAVGATLPVTGGLRLDVAGRTVGAGRLGRSDGARTATLDKEISPDG